MPRNCRKALLLVVLMSTAAFGGGTKFWSSSTFEDFTRGNLSGVSLSREGLLELAPALEEIFNTEQAMIWAVAHDRQGNLYLGTGHSGKVFRLDANLKSSLFFDAPEPDVFALAVDKDGWVYVGTSPEGKVYKVDPSGQAEDFFQPQAKYIWAMGFDGEGDLYVGTGDRGRIYRVRPNGEDELFYDTEQSHVISLALRDNELIAGTEPNGLLYRVSRDGKGFVIYDAPLAEIHSLAVSPDGSIYATAMGGMNERPLVAMPVISGGGQAPIRTSTTVTVRAADEPAFPPGDGGGQPDQPGPGTSAQVTVGGGQGMITTGSARMAGPQATKSMVFRVGKDDMVETLWNSTQESAFGVLPSGENLLFSTDEKGRIYELTPDRRLSLLTQTGQEETTRLIPFNNLVLATTANMGKVFQLGSRPAASGFLESEVRDAGNTASWGQIRWTADAPAGTSVELYTRTGNSRRPDSTWSEWSPAYRQSNGEQIGSPVARYIQWKAVLNSETGQTPALHEITVAYLPRNRAPELSNLQVTPRNERTSPGAQAAAMTVTQAGTRPGTPRVFSGVNSPRPSPDPGWDIRWTAMDPDQDNLTATLYFRGEGESEWKVLEADLSANYFALNNDVLPDGKYRVKIVVSDAETNPATLARTDEKISPTFIVDSTPPLVEAIQKTEDEKTATMRFRAFDTSNSLVRAEYAVDAGPLVPILSEDGMIDSQEEFFTLTLPLESMDGSEHLMTLRVYDRAGNVGVGKALWSASKPAADR